MEPSTILVVEDDTAIRETLAHYLGGAGYRVELAPSAEHALGLLSRLTPDLVIADVSMGKISGVELCARLKQNPRFHLTPVIIVTGLFDQHAGRAGLVAGADCYLSKPLDHLQLLNRVAALLRVKFVLQRLERSENPLATLGLSIEAKDPYTKGHCERLARYSVALGMALDVDQPTLTSLWLGGYLHDLGKIAVPDRVLLKPGPLEPFERRQVEIHPVVGADLVQGLQTLEGVRHIIRHHHEHWDGSGYPDGLKGEEIPLAARIMAVVDVYDALRTERPYKPAFPPDKAVSILLEETERGLWDPAVIEAFLKIRQELGWDGVA